MNERIQELAYEAEDYADSKVDEGGEFHIHYTQKFAELIVKECANRLIQDDFGSVKGVMSIAGARLKEHFGLDK